MPETPKTEPSCLFCRIRDAKVPATLVHRDAHVLAFEDVAPKAPFHVLVIPLAHIATLNEAHEEDAETLGRLMWTGAKLAAEAGVAESGFRVVVNTGPAAGQSVFHVHLHVLGGRALSWPPG